jgi:hypothetical protein
MEINVLAVTWYDKIGGEFERWIEQYLDASAFDTSEFQTELSEKIDVVLVWSRSDTRRNGWRRFYPRLREISSKCSALSRLLVEPDAEDRSRPFLHRFARSIPEVIAMEGRDRGPIVRC